MVRLLCVAIEQVDGVEAFMSFPLESLSQSGSRPKHLRNAACRNYNMATWNVFDTRKHPRLSGWIMQGMHSIE